MSILHLFDVGHTSLSMDATTAGEKFLAQKGLQHVEAPFEEHIFPDRPNAQVEDEASIAHLPRSVADGSEGESIEQRQQQ